MAAAFGPCPCPREMLLSLQTRRFSNALLLQEQKTADIAFGWVSASLSIRVQWSTADGKAATEGRIHTWKTCPSLQQTAAGQPWGLSQQTAQR